MRLHTLTLHPLQIPFKTRFKHSSAERSLTQSVLVAARTDSGCLGLGEGCPREYVTAESIASAERFFATHRDDLINTVHSITDLRQWIQSHAATIEQNPAAWCAIELALLDAVAKDQHQSIEYLLDLPELSGPFHYTAVLGDGPLETLTRQVQQYAALGFRDFKVKITGDPSLDNAKYVVLHAAVKTPRVRLDANNLWSTPDQVLAYLDAISINPYALEEPLQALDHTGLNTLAAQQPAKLILDESFLSQAHFAPIEHLPESFIINLRISKIGGLLRSLTIVRMAAQRKIPLIIGAQVGETSILTRAALCIANICGDALIGQEGAFGTLLLERDITDQPLTFGKNGLLATDLLTSSAYGLQIAYALKNMPALQGEYYPEIS